MEKRGNLVQGRECFRKWQSIAGGCKYSLIDFSYSLFILTAVSRLLALNADAITRNFGRRTRDIRGPTPFYCAINAGV